MILPYFDLHCDTLYERYRRKGKVLHLDKDGDFHPRRQIYAVWTEHGISADEAYLQFFKIADGAPDGAMLAVEGGQLLANDLSRLDTIAEYDPLYFTLVWQDACPIGGAWNTDEGLTAFGKDVVLRLGELGIIPDLSHASERMFWDVAEITDTFIATHSNSRAVCAHKRNLSDEQFITVRDNGGVVGISLCPYHLRDGGGADVTDVMKHIEHYLALGGERAVCLGCDFDGIAETPEGLGCPAELYALADAMARAGYNDGLIRDIFYNNANNYFTNKKEAKQ